MAVFNGTISMKRGSTGDNVKKLQEYLKQWNYYSRSIDGVYGQYTEEAVKKFQRTYNLPVDGWFGPKTAKKFNDLIDSKEKETKNNNSITNSTYPFDCPNINLKKGNTGDNVTKLQTILKARGYYTRQIDGDFGKYTEEAVKSFQQTQNNLLVDGVFGPDTCDKLKSFYDKKQGTTYTVKEETDPTPTYLRTPIAKLTLFPTVVVLPTVELDSATNTKTVSEGGVTTDTNFDCSKISLKRGSQGGDVKKLQTILKARGYYTRQIDGDFGKYTEEAVKRLQTLQGNEADGWFGQKTCTKLQGSSTTSATQEKKKEYIITDFQKVSTSNDAEGLSSEVTIQTTYTKEKYENMRKLQKTEFSLMVGTLEVYNHKGYVNDIKLNHEDDSWLIELSLVTYNAFLEKTLESFEKTAKRSVLLKELILLAGLKADVDLSGLPDEEFTLKLTAEAKNTTGGGGLTTLSGNDCTGHMQTNQLSARSFDINQCGGNTKIGNSSANYAVDTKNMTAREAVMDVYNRFKYGMGPGNSAVYYDNERCPRTMWNTNGKIYGNCADISRLIKCVGEVHGLKVGIRHCPAHYYNLIEIDGQTYRFDCCFKSGTTGAGYGGESCNTLTMRGGPWSK